MIRSEDVFVKVLGRGWIWERYISKKRRRLTWNDDKLPQTQPLVVHGATQHSNANANMLFTDEEVPGRVKARDELLHNHFWYHLTF